MDGRISMYVLLVCVWCSLDAGGFLMVVTAEPTVSAVILTSEADRKEGGQVDMRCTARNLESDHIVDWRTEGQTLRWGEATVWNANGRFIFDTSVDLVTQTVVQDFTITDVQMADTDEYVCNINDPRPGGGHNIVATSSVTLSVFYFPSESFPMCSPAGPITVDAGTELDMTCSSKSSYGTVTLTINPTIQTSRYTTWTSVIIHDIDTVVRKLDLTVDDADNGVSFECVIASMYFPNMLRTCQIGPITVRNTMTIPLTETTAGSSLTSNSFNVDPKTSPMAQITTASQSMTSQNDDVPNTMTFLCSCDPGSSPTPWILAFITVLVFAVTLIVIIIILIFRDVRKNRLIESLTSEKESQVTKPDPYMELQPTEVKNRVYMEPGTAKETTTTHAAYYQPVEVENESPEHDYARPEGSTNTSYEAVKVPQSSAERQYQNINN